MAIDIVEIQENSSAIPDESICLRLSLLPIYCENLAEYTSTEKCECKEEGCRKCGVTFSMNVSGKDFYKNLVSSDDIIIDDENTKVLEIGRFPIMYLRKNENVNLRGWILKGNGKMHAKWNPVNSVTFKKINDNYFRFSFGNNGLISNKDILEKSMEKLLNS